MVKKSLIKMNNKKPTTTAKNINKLDFDSWKLNEI